MNESEAVIELRKAVDGMTYPSETDAEIQAFSWGKVAPVEEREAAEFFDVYSDDEAAKQEDAKFQKLRTVVNKHLTDIKFFRVPDEDNPAEIWLYLFGKTADGEIVGLMTMVVET